MIRSESAIEPDIILYEKKCTEAGEGEGEKGRCVVNVETGDCFGRGGAVILLIMDTIVVFAFWSHLPIFSCLGLLIVLIVENTFPGSTLVLSVFFFFFVLVADSSPRRSVGWLALVRRFSASTLVLVR